MIKVEFNSDCISGSKKFRSDKRSVLFLRKIKRDYKSKRDVDDYLIVKITKTKHNTKKLKTKNT